MIKGSIIDVRTCADYRKNFENFKKEYKDKALDILNKLEEIVYCENIMDEHYNKYKADIQSRKEAYADYLDYLDISYVFPALDDPKDYKDYKAGEPNDNIRMGTFNKD